MREVLLIARQEYLKFITRRGTLIGILILPIILGLSIGIPVWVARTAPADLFTVIDRSNHGYDTMLAERLKQTDTNRLRQALHDYALASTDMEALRRRAPTLAAMLEAPDNDARAQAEFERLGGAPEILAEINPFLKPDAPGFTAPPLRWIQIPAPENLRSANPAQFLLAVRPYLVGTAQDAGRLRYVVVVPQNFGAAPGQTSRVEIWRDTPATGAFTNFINAAFTSELRLSALAESGLGRERLLSALGSVSGVNERSADSASDRRTTNVDRLKTFVPSALAYLLLISVLSNAGMLLGGVIEEKSNRVVELILSCTTPMRFMAGKLLGALGSALTMLGILVAIGIAGAAAFAPGGLSFLSALGDMPLYQYAVMAIYFISALLIYSSIYLAVGSMMPSMQDAQSFIAPMMIVIMLPFFFISAVMASPNGTIATVLSWIPIYTPFLMMVRLPWNPPLYDIIGTAALIVLTSIFMTRKMGRVFAANVLVSEKPPNFGALLKKLFRFGRA